MAADLVAEGICTDEDLAKLDADVMAWVDEAVAFAEAGTLEPVGDLTRFVTAEDTSGGAS
jgi:TPP-dependent pyruvate/acetoin dehydrogenase alpha subunit